MKDTPNGERVRISFFGRRNVGKSSLVNAITGQNLSIVSEYAGTTTDLVQKAMELLPLGPVLLTDTAGLDDEGELGKLRIEKTLSILPKTDIAVIVSDGEWGALEKGLIQKCMQLEIPFYCVDNKADLITNADSDKIRVSARTGEGIAKLKQILAQTRKPEKRQLAGDLVSPYDIVILVTPIDESAPKGRLILPQQQVIRDLLDARACCVVVQGREYGEILKKIPEPRLVITDSQIFGEVAAQTPPAIPLTSFSILIARYKGFLPAAMRGITALRSLKDGDTVLIAEGCTHHRQCNDIGSVQLPRKIREYTKKNLNFQFCSGGEYPDLTGISLIMHCGGCMLSEREMLLRMQTAEIKNIPFTNYGIFLSEYSGILERATELFRRKA